MLKIRLASLKRARPGKASQGICIKFYSVIHFDNSYDDALEKSHKSPFDKLRANGGQIEIINFIPFVVSLSSHR